MPKKTKTGWVNFAPTLFACLQGFVSLVDALNLQLVSTAFCAGVLSWKNSATFKTLVDKHMKQLFGLQWTPLCQIMQQTGAKLTGSYLLQQLDGAAWVANDLDIFVDEDRAEPLFEYFYSQFAADPSTCKDYHDSIPVSRILTVEHQGLKIQLISVDSEELPWETPSVDGYVDAIFDLAFIKNTFDGRRLQVHAKQALRDRSASLVRTDGHISAARDVARRDKYVARGFLVPNFTFVYYRVLSHVLVKRLFVDNVDSEDFVRGRDIQTIFGALDIELDVFEETSRQPWVTITCVMAILQGLVPDENKLTNRQSESESESETNNDGDFQFICLWHHEKCREAREKLVKLFPLYRETTSRDCCCDVTSVAN
jgi:hypothetical protein